MITIFSNPRPFRPPFAVCQRNAIESWLALRPQCQIFLINDELDTTRAIAKEYGVECIDKVKTSPSGCLLLDDVFRQVYKAARFPVLAQVNIDILLPPNFLEVIGTLPWDKYYMMGGRWDMPVKRRIHFKSPHDWNRLNQELTSFGKKHPIAGSDYWVFPKKLKFPMPPFLIGRPAADNWLIYEARRQGVPVIDTTAVIDIIHQEHPRMDGQSTYEEEVKQNQALYRKATQATHPETLYFDLTDADHILDQSGLIHPPTLSRRIQKQLLYARYAPDLVKPGMIKTSIQLFDPIIDQAVELLQHRQ